MSDKRYYYDEPIAPLAPLWMGKNHGMRFTDQTGTEIWMGDMHRMPPRPMDGRYYIHPDSVHLLEPREGDWVDTGDDFLEWSESDTDFLEQEARRFEGAIIQRNGLPFHWPKVEDAS